MILCLETATPVCSVALCDRTGVISLRENHINRSHASLLTVFIEEVLQESGIIASGLEAVAVSKGPGSYTGLRIGVSVAKGIAYGASIPLIGIDTTLSMFHGMTGNVPGQYGTDETSLYCPMLDARRMEVYYTLYNTKGDQVRGITAEIINEKSFSDIPESIKIIFFGEGSKKCDNITGHKNSIFDKNYIISAASMQKPAYNDFDNGNFADVAYFEPFYLKDFITTVQRKNILK